MENFPNYAGYGQTPTVCVNHPNRVSYAQCKRCNRTVCGECQTAQDAGVVCPDCYLTSMEAPRARRVPSSPVTGILRTRSF